MTILVTGATGTVGRNLVAELDRRGEPVRSFAGDFAEPDTVAAAMTGIDQVYVITPNHPQQVKWETGVIDAAVAAGVRRIVKQSTVGAETGSPLEFWDAHGRLEEHLRGAGVPWVLLRANFFMSNVLMSAQTIREAGAMFLPGEGAKVAMVDPRDVARAAAAVLLDADVAGRSYDLTGPAAVTFDDVAAALTEVVGRPVGFVSVPDDAARAQLIEGGMPEWFATNLVTLFNLLRDGAAASVSDGVRALTGAEPTPVASFIRDHASVFA
jgi:uncharacterized protein YbjT (DUF2867 family)